MTDLNDYNGEFRPDLKISDFHKDILVRLWHVSSRNFGQRFGEWYRLVRERFGEKAAQQITCEVWMRQHKMLDLEERYVAGALNIQDRDLIGLLKSMQWDVGQQGMINTALELVDNNPYHGKATIHKCWIYEYAWRTGDFSYLDCICDLDLYGYQEVARWYNPSIQAVLTKAPSHERKDEIPCQWEFFIPGKAGRIEVQSLHDYCGPELNDYSGSFLSGENTDEAAAKFSKQALARIVEAGGRLETALAGLYLSAAHAL